MLVFCTRRTESYLESVWLTFNPRLNLRQLVPRNCGVLDAEKAHKERWGS